MLIRLTVSFRLKWKEMRGCDIFYDGPMKLQINRLFFLFDRYLELWNGMAILLGIFIPPFYSQYSTHTTRRDGRNWKQTIIYVWKMHTCTVSHNRWACKQRPHGFHQKWGIAQSFMNQYCWLGNALAAVQQSIIISCPNSTALHNVHDKKWTWIFFDVSKMLFDLSR